MYVYKPCEMEMLMFNNIITAVIVICVVLAAIKLFTAPLRLMLKLALNIVCGFVALFLFNLLSGFFGFQLEVNLITAAIVGIFGLPGFGLLLILKWLL